MVAGIVDETFADEGRNLRKGFTAALIYSGLVMLLSICENSIVRKAVILILQEEDPAELYVSSNEDIETPARNNPMFAVPYLVLVLQFYLTGCIILGLQKEE